MLLIRFLTSLLCKMCISSKSKKCNADNYFVSNVLDLQVLKEMWDFSIAQLTCFDVQWLSRIDRSLIFTTPHVWIIKYALEIILEQNRHYHEASVAIISTYMLHVRWYDVIKCLSSGLRDIILHVYIEIFRCLKCLIWILIIGSPCFDTVRLMIAWTLNRRLCGYFSFHR